MTDDLVAFLKAILDEDEQAARDCPPTDGWWATAGAESAPGAGMAQLFVEQFDPARVLAEVQAKRRIIDLHKPREYSRPYLQLPNCICCSYCAWQPEWPCVTMRLLALPYAGHDSYRPEWAPDTEVNRG